MKPNIILILTEELRSDFLGYTGNKDSETPFLDKLANESVTFLNHFTVHSKCVPSRTSLFSGRYPHVGGHRTLGIFLRKGEINLAEILKNNGYYNAITQKNHVIEEKILMDYFNEFWSASNKKKGVEKEHNKSLPAYPQIPGNKYADNYVHGKINVDEKECGDYIKTQHVVDFIKNHDHAKPFFININYSYTHPPYGIMEPYYSKFMKKNLKLLPDNPGKNKPEFMYKLYELHNTQEFSPEDRKEMLALYYGMLNYIDNRVKEIYNALKETNELENTIIIFTADHGDFVGQYGIPEKWDTIFSDCLIKIPLIIRYPKEFSHRMVGQLNENIDILPTILDILKIEKPYGIQGKSLVPLMNGERESHKDYVFTEGGHEEDLLKIHIPPETHSPNVPGYIKKATLRNVMPDSLRKAKMIRTEKYKLVYRIKDKSELYDLYTDPYELNNLYNDRKYIKIKEDLKKKLLDHLIETEENLPFDPKPIA